MKNKALGLFVIPVLLGAASPSAVAAADVTNLFVNIADNTMPSVVNILTTKRIRLPRQRAGNPDELYDLWRGFFEDPNGDAFSGARPLPQHDPRGSASASRPMALGTGFVIEAFEQGGGLILTNNHVIAGADEVKVKFTENDAEHESPATVIGTDPELDIALLKVKGTRKLHAVALGDSEKLKVGEWIAALGNPFGHGHSVSHGIVSAKARTLPGGFGKYLQVDAPINPGNSGGPLVNLNGEVVGINNAIDARGTGIGFAIPINAVKNVLAQLKFSGRVERGYIGIGVDQNVDPSGAPIVAQIMPGQPAAKAGLRSRDVIVAVNGKPVNSPAELIEAITRVPVGASVGADVLRAGKPMHFEILVAKRPDLRQARAE